MDIKETSEVLDAAGDLGALLVKHIRDGVQATDAAGIAAELMTRPDVIASLKRAADGIQNVPAELRDVDAVEGLDLATIGINNAKKVLTALKAS
jgi:hypothetical protein